MKRYDHQLLDVVLRLHQHVTGSSDEPLPDELVEFLRFRLRTWEPSASLVWSPFDDAVKKLVETAVEEFEAWEHTRRLIEASNKMFDEAQERT